MRKTLLLFFLLCGFQAVTAQIHEIGVFLGGSNYIGDVGTTTYIRPNEFAAGLLYKWNRSPRHAWRISYAQTRLSANDLDSPTQARKTRGLRFSNEFKELSLGMEFNWFDFNLHDGKKKFTPYVYTGLSGMLFDEQYYNGTDALAVRQEQGMSLAIPMILGMKTNVADHWVLGAEVGARWSFTDNLDGSYPKDENIGLGRFGNINNKDWYVFSGITLTYTFGNKPCYCAE